MERNSLDLSKLTIVIPCYNEADSIEKTIERVRKTNKGAKILVVDDASTDNTGEIAKRLGVEVVRHSQNRGYGEALKTGLGKAQSEFVAFLDADLTYDPKYIPVFLRLALEQHLDCVWGNRFGGKVNKMPLIRKIGNKIISLVFFFVTFTHVSDCACGERLLSKRALQELDLPSLPNDLDFITALTKRTVSRKLHFLEIPMDYSAREGQSKLNIFRHGYKMVKNVLIYK